MSRALLCAVLVALPLHSQVGLIALYTQFDHPAPDLVTTALKWEVASIMTPVGLRFEWRTLPARPNEIATELAVVTFKGRCNALPTAQIPYPDRRLGWSHVSDGVVLPFTDIDCDHIRAFLLKGLYGAPAANRDRLFGRAVGRVLAHELYHIFAQTTHHSAHGVDQPTYSATDLLSDNFVFNELAAPVHILRTNATPSTLESGGSPQAGRSVFVENGCARCHGAEGEGTAHGPRLLGGRLLDTVVLAAKIAKNEKRMSQRAHELNLGTPSLAEDELQDLVSFLNRLDR